jgi:hypothetical protein
MDEATSCCRRVLHRIEMCGMNVTVLQKITVNHIRLGNIDGARLHVRMILR